ncbi:hypothetical protein JOE21_003508 [Desmospora profundinema]|uniref:Uncharacterized protein n=1 Tax=Desmospora profundinema TaxID=1571184 RepID=A0ABU1IUQ9_9BACL|nr:hypothetical protein [Desmospora profundinema]
MPHSAKAQRFGETRLFGDVLYLRYIKHPHSLRVFFHA